MPRMAAKTTMATLRALGAALRARLPGVPSAAPPPPGRVRLGDLRRVVPISREFGFDRGVPVDRYFIEQFLARNASVIHGRVLEIGDDAYTRRFGAGRVMQRDVLHVHDGNPQATFVGSLVSADHVPSDAFDCVILTQTLHLIYDVPAALRTVRRILKPGGTLLATFPGISQQSIDEWRTTWFWSFTTLSARRLMAETFGESAVEIEAHGNVLAAIAFLHGLAEHELTRHELEHHDPAYELLITARAHKAV